MGSHINHCYTYIPQIPWPVCIRMKEKSTEGSKSISCRRADTYFLFMIIWETKIISTTFSLTITEVVIYKYAIFRRQWASNSIIFLTSYRQKASADILRLDRVQCEGHGQLQIFFSRLASIDAALNLWGLLSKDLRIKANLIQNCRR